MVNRIACQYLFLSLICLILTGAAISADANLAEAVKKDLREHNEYTAKNEEDATKKRLETIAANRFADWQKAAEQGIPEGQVLLAVCYHYGVQVTEDKKEAVKWMCKAAEQGHVGAVALLRQIEEEAKTADNEPPRLFQLDRLFR